MTGRGRDFAGNLTDRGVLGNILERMFQYDPEGKGPDMARTKEFDRDQALKKAMMLFWAQGYTATSVQQLLHVMGLSRSSMYAEFGDKRDLFVQAMSLYSSYSDALFEAISGANDPVSAVRNFYEVAFASQPGEWLARGCLLVNTILELRDVDEKLSFMAARYFDKIEKAFAECFRRCASNGSLQPGLDPQVLAAFIVTVIKGMRVAARQSPGEAYLRGVMETALLVFQGDMKTGENR
jgi:TetR/AcrR family transcriptional repressor of nem operon